MTCAPYVQALASVTVHVSTTLGTTIVSAFDCEHAVATAVAEAFASVSHDSAPSKGLPPRMRRACTSLACPSVQA